MTDMVEREKIFALIDFAINSTASKLLDAPWWKKIIYSFDGRLDRAHATVRTLQTMRACIAFLPAKPIQEA